MEISVYNSEGGCDSRSLLAFIHEAFAAGRGVAVPEVFLPFFGECGLLNPVRRGDFRGSYLFRCIRQRSRRCSVAERAAALLVLIFLLPVILITGLLVLLCDGLPVIFRQIRFGLDGGAFDLYKFRTMVVNGEDLHGLLQHLSGEEGRLFKLENDPRVTALGKILRICCLDELPQLVNVIRGEMRLCGPRPLPVSDNHHYMAACHRMRLRGRPGITGLWQVNGRNRRSFDEMCLLDVYYLCNNSLWMDLKIILRTVAVVLLRRS